MEHFELHGEFKVNDSISVHKFKSRESPMSVYFMDIDSMAINGYFGFGIDTPEGNGIETLLWHIDSSGGLLPKPLRGDIVRPVWQLHGAENPLADRDSACLVCCGLGEQAFLPTFACSAYIIQGIEAIFEMNGVGAKTDSIENGQELDGANPGGESLNNNSEDFANEESEMPPIINNNEDYYLSEAGEGAMAWEVTLQEMIPSPVFWNRLLCSAKTRITPKMREAYDKLYRPENLTVVIAGKVIDRNNILETLRDYEANYKAIHPEAVPFVKPWSSPLFKNPTPNSPKVMEVRFTPRNVLRTPTASVCFGWKGCKFTDIETGLALKVLSAYMAVGPLWAKFITSSHRAERISWCQLDYIDTCSLITIHGIPSDEIAEDLCRETVEVIQDLVGSDPSKMMQLDEIVAMAIRVSGHHLRELETEPYVVITSAIMKAERYGNGLADQVNKRLNPQTVLQELQSRPLEFWKNLAKSYFLDSVYITKVLPKSYAKPVLEIKSENEAKVQTEAAESQSFASSSRKASSRLRNAIGKETSVMDLSEAVSNLKLNKSTEKTPAKESGHLENLMATSQFPFGDYAEEAQGFEERLSGTIGFLEQALESEHRSYHIETYVSDGLNQHLLFPVNDMPFYTILEDLQSSFVYVTLVIDTTHLNPEMRKLIPTIIAALGAAVCPRPPGLDTDFLIENPNEFNPPKYVSDSQVSLGLNGELMQSVFFTLIVKPEHYRWVVGMFHYLLHEFTFSMSFLKFIATEAVKAMAGTYRLQTADAPNYDCFDAAEINLYPLVKLIYKEESNARLFVGRKRMDLLNEYLSNLDKEPIKTTELTNLAWKEMTDSNKIILQIAGDITKLAKIDSNLIDPWHQYFPHNERHHNFEECGPVLDKELIKKHSSNGISVSVNHCRPSCLSTAIEIPVDSVNFPKICLASQVFSLAQKWSWACIDEEDVSQHVLKMPALFSNILTLNIESRDVVGAFGMMKKIINENYQWLKPLLIASKLIVANDPACVDPGPQGAIITSLMARLNGQSTSFRLNMLMEALKVTPEDIQDVVRTHFWKLFDPTQCWYSFMGHEHDQDKIKNRLEQLGFKFEHANLKEICTQL